MWIIRKLLKVRPLARTFPGWLDSLNRVSANACKGHFCNHSNWVFPRSSYTLIWDFICISPLYRVQQGHQLYPLYIPWARRDAWAIRCFNLESSLGMSENQKCKTDVAVSDQQTPGLSRFRSTFFSIHSRSFRAVWDWIGRRDRFTCKSSSLEDVSTVLSLLTSKHSQSHWTSPTDHWISLLYQALHGTEAKSHNSQQQTPLKYRWTFGSNGSY